MAGRVKSKRVDQNTTTAIYRKQNTRSINAMGIMAQYQETLGAEMRYERVYITHRDDTSDNDKWVAKSLRKTFLNTHAG